MNYDDKNINFGINSLFEDNGEIKKIVLNQDNDGGKSFNNKQSIIEQIEDNEIEIDNNLIVKKTKTNKYWGKHDIFNNKKFIIVTLLSVFVIIIVLSLTLFKQTDTSVSAIPAEEKNSIEKILKETLQTNSSYNTQITVTYMEKKGNTVNLDVSYGEYTNSSQIFNGLYHFTLTQNQNGSYTVSKCISYKIDVSFPYVKASSILPYKLGANYYPEYLIDGKFNTSWVEGISGSGVGEWVMLYADKSQVVRGVKIINGYAKNPTTFEENYFLKRFSLEFSDGSTIIVNLDDEPYAFTKKYSIDPFIVYFDKAINTTYIKLTILEVGYLKYGLEYEDTSISEITPF